VVVNGLQDQRIVGREAIEILERKAARLIGELLLRPAAEHNHPFARTGGTNAVSEQPQRVLARGDTVEPQLVVLGRAYPVGMVVDEPGDDGPASEVDDPRAVAGALADVVIAPNRDDALPFDRQRLRNREAVVHRHDVAVDQNDVSRLCCLSQGRHH